MKSLSYRLKSLIYRSVKNGETLEKPLYKVVIDAYPSLSRIKELVRATCEQMKKDRQTFSLLFAQENGRDSEVTGNIADQRMQAEQHLTDLNNTQKREKAQLRRAKQLNSFDARYINNLTQRIDSRQEDIKYYETRIRKIRKRRNT